MQQARHANGKWHNFKLIDRGDSTCRRIGIERSSGSLMERILEALARAKQDEPAAPLRGEREDLGVEPINHHAIRSLTAIPGDVGQIRTPAGQDFEAAPAPGHGAQPAGLRRQPVSLDRLRANRVIAGFEGSAPAEAYRVIATQVLQLVRENDWNVLAVVSPGFGEGKTLTCVNLAITLARGVDQHVLLVDADLRVPKVHACLGLPGEPGLSDHLTSEVPLEEVLVDPGIERLLVLPGGRPLRSASELLGSHRMRQLLARLKRRVPAPIVIFDLPPVLVSADALAFLPLADAVIMVVEEGKTGSDDAMQAAQLLQSTNLIGTVLNKSRHSSVEERPRFKGWASRTGGRREPRLNGMPQDDSHSGSPAPAPAPARTSFWTRLLSRAGK
jgi:capsular exopolysaccharide synthesis family protein